MVVIAQGHVALAQSWHQDSGLFSLRLGLSFYVLWSETAYLALSTSAIHAFLEGSQLGLGASWTDVGTECQDADVLGVPWRAGLH